jgi:hypothetical protein
MYLFSDMDLGIQFLNDVGLIRSKVMCNTCGRNITWCADPKRKDGPHVFTLFSLHPPRRWRSTVSVEFFAVGACRVVLCCVD